MKQNHEISMCIGCYHGIKLEGLGLFSSTAEVSGFLKNQ
jgi:hypothetical protein